MYQSGGDRLLLAQGNTVALKVALCALRRFPMAMRHARCAMSATISYALCAMCYALCDDFLCVAAPV